MAGQYDLIVVGGGCNGTGIARDAAMRGISVLLLEKNDFAAGTTGASSGMIHGGPRYLLYEVGTTKLACQDAGYILKIAPHLCFRIPFLVPVLQEDEARLKTKIRLELIETFFELYDRYSPLKGGKKHTRLTKEELKKLEPSIPESVEGAVSFDEWGIDTHRLCVANALAARDYGAHVFNHATVTKILKEGNRVLGVEVRHGRHGQKASYYGRIVFNATGPWSPQFAALAGCAVRLRPAKGIHLVFDRRLTNMAIVAKCIDGRQIFINPHENSTLVGTTDDDYYGDLDDIPVTEDEIEYLLTGIETVFPEVRRCRIVTTWRGVRPTLFGRDCYEDELSREHEIIDHEEQSGVPGFMSMIGGKLASYRVMAEEATDRVAKKLSVRTRCQTHLVPLPGGQTTPDVKQLAEAHGVDPFVVRRLSFRHGDHTEKILAGVAHVSDKSVACLCEPVTVAELKHALAEEWADNLSDLMRRTRCGSGPCQGSLCALPALECLAGAKELTPRQCQEALTRFLDQLWQARRPVLGGEQLAQEELNRAVFVGTFRSSAAGTSR